MRQEKQIEILKELMHQLDSGTTHDAGIQYKIDTSAYTDPELAEREFEMLFRNQPQLIGFSGDLPESGSFFTIDDLGTPIVATRDKAGRFHAFVNACRHRGARVAQEPKGKTPMLVCPFHKWSYATDGRLVGVPEMELFGEIDKSCHGLVELPSEEKFGMLWVQPNVDGTCDIEAMLGELGPELADLDFGAMIPSGEKTIDMALNWKLANDTFGETYHFGKLHSDTLAKSFYGGNLHYEVMGKHHRFVTASRTIDRLQELPEEDWDLAESSLCVYFLFPNVQLIIGVERATLVRIYPHPNNPGRSVSRISAYFMQSQLDAIEIVPEELRVDADNIYAVRPPGAVLTPQAVFEVFTSTIEHEDYVMGEQQQAAAASGQAPSSIFGRNEAALHHFHNSYRETLGMAPLEKVG